MEKYVVETKGISGIWQEHFQTDTKSVDQDEFKVFVKIYAKLFWANQTYRILHRSEFVLTELPSEGFWRIQVKYKKDVAEDQRYFDGAGFGYWGDINVIKASGYKSYDEAFKVLKESKFEKANPNFIWRIIQD